SLLISLLPRSTLLPYTTLFRSRRKFDVRSAGQGIDEIGNDGGSSAHYGGFTPSRYRLDPVHPVIVGFGIARCRQPHFGSELRLRSEEHTSELQSRFDLVCRLLL